jgi:hypothetical protein
MMILGCGESTESDGPETEVSVDEVPFAQGLSPRLNLVDAVASHSDTHVARNAIDGDTKTRWSGKGLGVTVTATIEVSALVDAVELFWFEGAARTATYDLLVSRDGSRFEPVVVRAQSQRLRGAELVQFPPRSARFVRLIGHGNTVNDWTSIREFRVRGRPEGTSVDAGTPEDAGWPLTPNDGGTSVDAGAPEDAGWLPTPSDGGLSMPLRDGGAMGNVTVPAQVIDLSVWKITLPIPGSSTTSPREVLQPELATFSISPHFQVTSAQDGVQFRAHAGGTTTSGSSYPRSELREMKPGGTVKADWATTSGLHVMTVTQAITHTPTVKPHVVAGQIHDANDDVIMIRLEGKRLFVEGSGADLGVLADNYVLGTFFTVRIEASNGSIRVFYEDLSRAKVEVRRAATGCYFKAGAYTQSNTRRGDGADAFGQVIIRRLSVEHR